MAGRRWTNEEITFLEDNYGKLSLDKIAKKLNRTTYAVVMKRDKMKMGPIRESCDYLTFNYVTKVLCGLTNTHSRKFLLNIGCPAKKKKFITKQLLIVNQKALWKWLEENRNKLNFRYMNPGDLGYPEPAWADIKRSSDKNVFKQRNRINKNWTSHEDRQLIFLVEQYKFNAYEIAKMLNRTERAVQKRLFDIGIKARPIKCEAVLYTKEDEEMIIDMYNKGYRKEDIAKKLNRTERSISAKLWRMKNAI